MLAWKRGTLKRAKKPLWGWAILAVALAGLTFAIQSGRSALGPIGVALGVWVVGGALLDLWLRGGRGGWADRLRRIRLLPRADWGKAVAHIGVGVTTFAVAGILAWQVEDIRVADIGDSYDVDGYTFTLSDVRSLEGPNYVTTMATIDVTKQGRDVTTLFPERRFYPVAQMPTTEAAIRNGVLRDLYVVIGEPQGNGGWAVRVYIKPFANWIWGGCILMALGALISLTDRRLRVGAGATKTRRPAVPAE